jgi:hypothetical protein
MGRSELLPGPHEQGIGIIGTMGIPMPPMVPMLYRNRWSDEAVSEATHSVVELPRHRRGRPPQQRPAR